MSTVAWRRSRYLASFSFRGAFRCAVMHSTTASEKIIKREGTYLGRYIIYVSTKLLKHSLKTTVDALILIENILGQQFCIMIKERMTYFFRSLAFFFTYLSF
jgi:hypothetical protein